LEYTVSLGESSLTIALKLRNPKDSASTVKFNMSYHNSIAVSNVQNARVSGLSEGSEYKDTVGKWGGGDIDFDVKTGK
jgi:D-hexose-6-phosphate mutarotase